MQGVELDVIAGARESLATAVAVQCELTFAALYDGQSGALDVIGALREAGFVLAALAPAFADPVTGELLQVDGMFVRPDWGSETVSAVPAES